MFTKLHNDKFYNLNNSVLITLFSFHTALSLYRAVNTFRLSFKIQSVSAV